MVDQRLPDLGYGQPGEVSYDSKTQQWIFPRTVELSGVSKAISTSLKTATSSIHSSTRSLHHDNPSIVQKQWLAKAVPESVAASTVLSSHIRVEQVQDRIESREGLTLLAHGKASDSHHRGSRQRDIPVFALSDGEAGQLLKIIRPHTLVQKGHNGLRLRTMSLVSAEEGYHFIPGSSIRQIFFASDTESSTSWLAVRNAEATMIFRPIYCQFPIPSEVPGLMKRQCPPSRLFPNLIVTLPVAKTGDSCHTDVSFNPWYVKQFVVIDANGHWSIWDIEGQKRKRTTFVTLPGKSGHVSDNINLEATSMPLETETWGRALWAGSVNTLVVCQRQQLALFDVKSAPKRLTLPDIFRMDPERFILDVKRNPARLDQIFVLTTSRIVVIEIAVDGRGSETNSFAASVLLSCPHFRDSNSESLKLEILKEPDACLALLYSTQNSVINTYRLSFGHDRSTNFSYFHDTFPLHTTQDGTMSVVTLLASPIKLFLESTLDSSQASLDIIQNNLRLYEVFFLTENFDLHRTLLAATNTNSHILVEQIAALRAVSTLTDNFAHISRIKSSKNVTDDNFIIPDDLDDETPVFDDTFTAGSSHLGSYSQSNRLFTVNACRLHASAFPGTQDKTLGHASIRGYIENIQHDIRSRKAEGQSMFRNCLELDPLRNFSDDVDEAAVLLRDMILSFEPLEENEAATVSFSSAGLFEWLENSSKKDLFHTTLNLSNIYDKLVEVWVTCLPRKAPAPLRLARERLIRSIAVEIFLSSLTVSIQKQDLTRSQTQEDDQLVLPLRTKPTSPIVLRSPKMILDGQDGGSPSYGKGSNLQPSARSPSSHATPNIPSVDAKAQEESVSRLRRYMVTAKSVAPLGPAKSSILAHWPTDLAADPSQYSWEITRKDQKPDQDLDSDNEEALKRQKDDERRRRRAERLLRRQRPDLNEASSPLVPTRPTGSQPMLPVPFSSSQPTEAAMPMSQPGRGAHGSRLGHHIKKKKVRAFR